MEEIKNDLLILWNYLCLNNKPARSDCIIGLGSILDLVAKKCANLYKANLGDYIIFSGNCGKGTIGIITETEAERFKKIAIENDVPDSNIFIEPEATTTYENIKYIKKLLHKSNLKPESFLIVGKPYQERRAHAIAEIELKDKNFQIASFNMELDEYIEYVKSNSFMKLDDIANEMVGEISLILLAPKYELQSKQEIPNDVLSSYNNLIDAGYSKYNYSGDMVKGFRDVMIKKRIIKLKRNKYGLK